MRIIISTILLLIFIGLNAQEQNYTIKGRVIDQKSEKPVYGVYVTTDTDGGQTDRNGYYVIKGLKPGKKVLSTMYYGTHQMEQVIFDLTKDTTINFVLKESVNMIDEVVVTGTRTEKKLSEAPVLTTLIKSRDIKLSGATSAMEALFDNIPGIVSTPNAMGNNLRIRGLNSRYILFLVDGERMVSEGAGGNVNLDQIDVNNIERVEMINGAASALYGSNAVGAVINIITKNPIHKFEGDANLIAESYNTLKAKIGIGTNTKKLTSRVSGFYNRSDGFDIDGGAYAAAYADAGADFKINYKPTNNLRIGANGRYFRHELFNPANSLSSAHPLTHTISTGLNLSHISKDGKNSLVLSTNYTNYIDTDYLEQLFKSEVANKSSYISTRLVDTYKPTEKWEVVGGLEHNYENIFATSTLGVVPTTRSLQDINVFGQAQYSPIKDFDIIAGARYTYNEEYNSAFTPKLSIMYKVDGFTFRGGVGTAFRAPSIKELYYDFDHQGMFWVYGNPDLVAEKGLYNSLSAEYVKNGFYVSASGYWNNINNKITQYDVVNESGALEKYYKNVSSATLKGVDINVSYNIVRQVQVKASYSYCDALDNSTGLQLESNVKHSGTASVTWNGMVARSPFSLQLSGRLTSPKLYQQQVTNSDGTITNELEESDPYNIWKITLVKPIRINKHTFELTFKCDNIFNFQEASYVNPGRQFLIGLRYAFK